MISRALILCMAAVATAGCFDQPFQGQGIKGSGKLKSETRQVTDFKAIDISGATTAYITVGPKASLKIETDDNLLDRVETEVSNNTLRIGMRGPISSSKGVKAWITVPQLDALDVSGASKTEVKGVNASKLTLDFSGASKATIAGTADELILDASGASNLELGDLKTRRASVDLSGASKLVLSVSEELRGDASGACSIKYKGSPRVGVEKSGASSVSKA